MMKFMDYFRTPKPMNLPAFDVDKIIHGFKYDPEVHEECNSCIFKGLCQSPGFEEGCSMSDYDRDKNTILLIDDNSSILQFLKEDMECLAENKVIKRKDLNLVTITGPLAAFNFHVLQQKADGLNIEWAIIDLEYKGGIVHNGANVKLNGVDIYETITLYNPNVNVLFYSNPLNPMIKSHRRMIDDFKRITGKNINDFVLKKTSLNIHQRRAEISDRLFGKDLGRHPLRTACPK